jgi:hypothetical protein
LLQEPDDEEAAALKPAARNQSVTTIHRLPDDLLRISFAFLLGNGHFRYHGIACKMLLKASEQQPGHRKITTAESVTYSIECAQKYFEDEGTGISQLRFFWYNASRYGRVEVMEWAHQQGYSAVWNQQCDPWSSLGSRTCEKAAKYGQLYVLQWLRRYGCAWNSDTCSAAALIGHLPILQWLRENGCDWNEMTCCNAARYGHLTCLQWARENGCDWNSHTCAAAADNGHLTCLQWARENGCDWDRDTCIYAAANGHLSCLQWARENGCDWDTETCYTAALNGRLSCFQWARDNGCPGADQYEHLFQYEHLLR